MELTFAWFWILQITLLTIGLYLLYRTVVVNKFKNKLLNIITILFMVLHVISPIKIEGTGSIQYKINQTYNIEQSKELPTKTEAKDWQKIRVDGITEEDLK